MVVDKSSSTTMNSVTISVGKLVLFLYFIPFIITLYHIQHNIHTHWDDATMIVNVNTASISAVASGIYGRTSSSSSQVLVDTNTIIYSKMLNIGGKSTTTNVFGIYQPDVLDAAESAVHSEHEFPYLSIIPTSDHGNSSEPCLFMSKGNKICGNDVIHIRSNSIHKTTVRSTTRSKHCIQHVIFQIPTTSFLILLNCSLAFLYWNKRISPETVAKMYNRIIPSASQSPTIATTEVWRVLTGTTAHFEPLHLGMNMLSLSALGKELEGRQEFTSISFLMYNISLMVLVPAIWLGLQRIVQKYYPNHFDANTATVGYSGVLFAWMVVASLGQTSTCPIIFAPNVCFPTYELVGPFKFSFSPLVQLAVMQMILPRVSFTGHLSGIIVGFLVHWELIPIRYFQPVLMVPILYLIYLWKIRKACPTSVDSSERSQNPMSRIKTILGYQVVVLIYSVTILGPINSTTLSFAVTIIYWYQLYQAVLQIDDPYNHVATWSKAYIFIAVLVLITDAMTIGGWAAFSSLKVMPTIVMLVRAILLFVSMIVAQTTVSTMDEGIFEWTLNYTTLHPCRELSHAYPWLVGSSSDHAPLSNTILPVRSASAFVGTGHRLGGSNSHKSNPWKVQRDHESKSQTS